MNKLLMMIAVIFLTACANTDLPSGSLDIQGTTFYVNDSITADMYYRFADLLEKQQIDTVVLTSKGGSVHAALSMGYLIKANNITTYVPEGKECNSACGLLFVAGKRRVLYGMIGMHELRIKGIPYANLPAQTKVDFLIVVVAINNYLGQMGIFHKFYTDSMQISANGMLLVGADHMQQYLLTGEIEGLK